MTTITLHYKALRSAVCQEVSPEDVAIFDEKVDEYVAYVKDEVEKRDCEFGVDWDHNAGRSFSVADDGDLETINGEWVIDSIRDFWDWHR
jgi:hypothetical protein